MEIIRYCGKERLPGGERLWRRLARLAGFDGVVKVYGYGAAGSFEAVNSHIGYERGKGNIAIDGLWTQPRQIEVWVRCRCSAALDEEVTDPIAPQWLHPKYYWLFVFAHELGHYRQFKEGKPYSERGASRRAQRLLEKVVNVKAEQVVGTVPGV